MIGMTNDTKPTDANGKLVTLLRGHDTNPAARRMHNVKAVQSCRGHGGTDSVDAMRLGVAIPVHLINGDITAMREFIASAS